MSGITTVLFDLDGTLIDTAPDMAAALNRLLIAENREPLPFSQIRPVVSKGSLALVQLAFGDRLSETRVRELQQNFLNFYSENICIESRLFDGLGNLLDELDNNAIRWGVITNKPAWLTEPLLKQLDLFERSHCVVSGDTLPLRKPHPEPLLHACKLIQRSPNECVYIGDDERDIIAGKAAGMTTLIAAYGYIDNGESPQNWGADGFIDSIADLRSWLETALFAEPTFLSRHI
jgi:phosphoglycolate phosphatase